MSAQSRIPESNDIATAMAIGHENGASVTQVMQPDRIAWHCACDDMHQESVMGQEDKDTQRGVLGDINPIPAAKDRIEGSDDDAEVTGENEESMGGANRGVS